MSRTETHNGGGRVGILGGGQLGAMLARSIQKLGHQVSIFDADPHAPALCQTNHHFVGAWTDESELLRFISSCSTVTYEFENVETSVLGLVAHTCDKPIYPSLSVLKTSQNRALEKEFLRKNHFPTAQFACATTALELNHAVNDVGFPCIVKTARFGYDGKGQWRIGSQPDSESFLQRIEQDKLHVFPCVIEEQLHLATEASAIVCRSIDGELTVFPVFENLHENHILAFSLLPARLPQNVCERITDIAKKIAIALELVGILAVEFFLTRDGSRHGEGIREGDFCIYVNEIAPRPHNSGHVTMAACTLSQFDALARILCRVPLTQPQMLSQKSFCMGNLLGDLWPAKQTELSLDALRTFPEVVDLNLYGKTEAKPGRKMGHFVAVGDSPDAALDSARRFRSRLASENQPKA